MIAPCRGIRVSRLRASSSRDAIAPGYRRATRARGRADLRRTRASSVGSWRMPDRGVDTGPAAIDIRPLETVDEVFAAADVLRDVWGGDRGGMPPNLCARSRTPATTSSACTTATAWSGHPSRSSPRPPTRSMHSHITGVLPEYQSHGLGRLLKQHQREWAFARDVGHITWTFDPLVARNAHFNLRVLGTRVTEYLVNHYGPDGRRRQPRRRDRPAHGRRGRSRRRPCRPRPTTWWSRRSRCRTTSRRCVGSRRRMPRPGASACARQFLAPPRRRPRRRRLRRRARVPVRASAGLAAGFLPMPRSANCRSPQIGGAAASARS